MYADEPSCHLWKYWDPAGSGANDPGRMVAEPLILLAAIFQLLDEGVDIRRIGWRKWWQTMVSKPNIQIYRPTKNTNITIKHTNIKLNVCLFI
jgi:hypothetical protein